MTMRVNVALALLLLLLLLLLVPKLAQAEDPIVETPLGFLEGHWMTSRSGRPFQAFEGVPYALPPVGELRFEPPQPVAPWEGLLSAKFPPTRCIQYAQSSVKDPGGLSGVEDCLYLAVYTPIEEACRRNCTKLMPVIIFFYGAGFQMGESFNWQPHTLMDKDLVFVQLNHRVGPLGFLSTEDKVVPGNMGLKDQSLAMKWVKENIESFGGDPNQVTLTGLSSGGACVQFHYLSPMSRGLFHRGISVSGTALNCWAQTEAALDKARRIGDSMGCPTNDNEAMIRCLKDRPANKITELVPNFLGYDYNPFVPFGPVVEYDSADPFLDKTPIETFANGEAADVPWLLSSDTEEGIYPAAEFLYYEERTKYVDEHWEEVAPYFLDFNYTIPESQRENVSRYIKHHYLGDRRIEHSNAHDVILMVGHRLYAMMTAKVAKEQARIYESPVWFYCFGYRGEHSFGNVFTRTNESFGVAHTDEAYYIFNVSGCPLHTEEDLEMSSEMVNLWYSFAKTGVPELGGSWPRVDRTGDDLNYLLVSAPGNYSLARDDDYGQQAFWSSIDFDENKPPSRQ